MKAQHDGRPAGDGFLISRRHSHGVLLLLFVLMLFDFIDRQVLAALLPYIKAEWQLSDTELGTLVSAVNVAIAVLAFPTAVIVDRWSRTKSIGVMAVLWSLATAACSFATSYPQMLAARLLVGTGEAGYSGAGTSLLAAIYPARLRSTVIGIYQAAGMVGTLLGVVLGGLIATRWGWRSAFGVVALPGLIAAIAVFFVRDYQTVALKVVDAKTQSFRNIHWHEVALKIFTTPVLLVLFVGQAAQFFFVGTLGNWLPSFFNRVYGMPLNVAGMRTGLVLLVAASGMVLGGWVIDKLIQSMPRARLIGPAVFSLMTSGLFFSAFSLPAGGLQQALLYGGAFFMMGVIGPVIAAIQNLVHPGMRSTAAGSTALTTNLFGMALGPIVAGIVSDRTDLQSALMFISAAPLVAALAYMAASFMYAREAAKFTNVVMAAEPGAGPMPLPTAPSSP